MTTKSDIKSPAVGNAAVTSNLGGMPPTKTVSQISLQNTPPAKPVKSGTSTSVRV